MTIIAAWLIFVAHRGRRNLGKTLDKLERSLGAKLMPFKKPIVTAV